MHAAAVSLAVKKNKKDRLGGGIDPNLSRPERWVAIDGQGSPLEDSIWVNDDAADWRVRPI